MSRLFLFALLPSAVALAPPVAYRSPPLIHRRAPPPAAAAITPMLAPLAGVAVLTSVVVIHELGHFSVARAQGIRVSEFSIGFGPKLWSRAATAP